MVEETKNVVEEAVQEPEIVWTEESARKALEEAREAESRAYKGMNRGGMTSRQKGILELAKLEEEENPSREILDKKCSLILESYYLPRALKDGQSYKLNKTFTRHEDEPDKDYIEASFTLPNGKNRTVGYNYKVDEDGKSLILFEKTFETIVLKPGEPEKYVLYDTDGETELMAYSTEELEKKIYRGEIVKVEDDYYRKATNADGEVRKGDTTMIVEDEGKSNVKIIMGNNEQEKYSISKTGQLVRATTNDVTTVTIETRKIAGPGPIFNTIDDARSAAAREMQNGETNLKVDVAMEGTTVAEFDFLPVYTTSIELTGLSKKIGKGVEDYDPEVSDEENLRKQLAKPINQYLDEKGYHVLDITCENITADVKENVGWINTMKTYLMTGGVVTVTYMKRHSAVVSLKQGFLGRGQGNDEKAILAQLPAGSELLNPQDIDWKNSKPTVTYVTRSHATGIGSAKSVNEADEAAAQNAIHEGQKLAVKGLNGGIASGIREAIAAQGAVSTVANVRVRMDTAVVSKMDMELTRREPKYAYTATCDKMVSNVENKLVSVTSWNCKKLVYVAATDPVLDKGIPTDENYNKYINEGDDIGILIFEKSDRNLRRYINEVHDAQVQAGRSIALFEKCRIRLKEAQEIFDRVYDEQTRKEKEAAQKAEEVIEEVVAEEAAAEVVASDGVSDAVVEEAPAVEEPVYEAPVEETPAYKAPVYEAPIYDIYGVPAYEEPVAEEAPEAPVLEETIQEVPVYEAPAPAYEEPVYEAPAPAVSAMSAQEALLEIFGESAATETPVEEAPAPTVSAMSAQEALLEIFGESAVTEAPVEAAPMLEAPVEVAETVEDAVVEPAMEAVEEVVSEVAEKSQEEVDDAFAKLLAGMDL